RDLRVLADAARCHERDRSARRTDFLFARGRRLLRAGVEGRVSRRVRRDGARRPRRTGGLARLSFTLNRTQPHEGLDLPFRETSVHAEPPPLVRANWTFRVTRAGVSARRGSDRARWYTAACRSDVLLHCFFSDAEEFDRPQ